MNKTDLHWVDDGQRRAMALATMLDPLLIEVMGAVMMLIAMAKLLPIIRLNQFFKRVLLPAF